MARVRLPSLPEATPLPGAVLFGFDDRAFPFTRHLRAQLTEARTGQVALPPGEVGAPDETIRFYGSVVQAEGAFHLWYFGGITFDPGAAAQRRSAVLCYATSEDGLTWRKPSLGLAAFNGSTDNNVVDLPHAGYGAGCAVLHDPVDPDPRRRFKIAYEAPVHGQPGRRLCVAFSADGLRWTPSAHNPVGPGFELCGVTRWRGHYYLNGQAPLTDHHPHPARRLATYVSPDFERWSPCSAVGLDRTSLDPLAEIHLGAALWNRGSVLLGSYGQWHGHPTGDRRLVSMDLGLVVSHDALHFHEPLPGFGLVPARETPGTPAGYAPSLVQGQGWANVGERTLHWYAPWLGPNPAGVLVASWERDRLGHLQPFAAQDACAIGCALEPLDGALELHANVSGLGEHTHLLLDVLDESFQPIDALGSFTIVENGFCVPVRIARPIDPSSGRVRLRVRFGGARPEDARLHALYLGDPT